LNRGGFVASVRDGEAKEECGGGGAGKGRRGLGAPAGELEDAAEADGVEGFGAAALAAEAGEFDQHLGGLGGVGVAKLDEIVASAFEAGAPVGRAGAVFGFLGAGGDGGEGLAVEVEVEDRWALFHIGRVRTFSRM